MDTTLYRILIFSFLIAIIPSIGVSQVYNIASENGNSISTCGGTFTDSDAFNGDVFLNNEEYLVTFCSSDPGMCLTIDFTSFDIQDSQDWLYVWDGTDTISGTFIGKFNSPTGSIMDIYPNGVQSTSGCLTFYFTSNSNFNTGTGWLADISCGACPTCFDGIQNGTETDIDCGGSCAPCPEPINIADGGTVTTCNNEFSDSGGIDGDYQNNENNTITICSDNPDPNLCLTVNFLAFDIENGFDNFFIYNGPDDSSPLIGQYSGTNSPGLITSTEGCLTFKFTSDGSVTRPGWFAEVSCGACPTCFDGIQNGLEQGVDCGGPDCALCPEPFNIADEGTINTCGGQFGDSGGLFDDYQNNEDYTMTFCSDNPDTNLCLQFDFIEFNIENGWEFLTVYDGPDNSSPVIDIYTGTASPGIISATGTCLTFNFTSDGIITRPGWLANISCGPCPTCFDGVQNGLEQGVDCGGPDCVECPPPITIDEEGTVNNCGGQFTDSGGFGGDYQNNEDNTITICSDNSNPNFCFSMDFTIFNIENGFDNFTIYDGPDVSSPIIGNYTGTNSPGLVEASGSCLTFNFTSDGSVTREGWVANMLCSFCGPDPEPDPDPPTIADCLGALPICSPIITQANPPIGSGNYTNEIPANACGIVESNVVWYIFDVNTDGVFNFTLSADTPQVNGDYNWVLYDITGLTCEDLSAAPSVSCNTYGTPTGTAAAGGTGISTANGGTGTANGPGNINGPAFNEDLNVTAGQTYALLVTNCCGATLGYTLDFSASTADIYDTTPPVIQSVDPGCAYNEIDFYFTQPVICSTVSAQDFVITGPGGTIPVLDATSIWCGGGNSSSPFWQFTFENALENNASYTISIVDSDGGIEDVCGNIATSGDITFTTANGVNISSVITPADCAADITTGTATISVSGGEAPYFIQLGSQNFYNETTVVFDGLIDNIYNVTVIDNQSCIANFSIEIPAVNSSMDNTITPINPSCNGGDGKIEASTTGAAGFGPWSYTLFDENGVIIFVATSTDQILIDSLDIGTYQLQIEDMSGLSACPDLREVVIGLPEPIFITTVNDTSVCNTGEAQLFGDVIGGTGAPFTLIWISDNDTITTSPGQSFSTGPLSVSSNYTVFAIDTLGCSSNTTQVLVSVNDTLMYDITQNQPICLGQEVYLSISNITGGFGSDYSVVWTIENGLELELDSVVVSPQIETTYCVNISDLCETPPIDSCVTISPLLSLDVSFQTLSDSTACPPTTVDFVNTTDSALVGQSVWTFGDGQSESSPYNVSHLYQDPGFYSVMLSVTTPLGCSFDTLILNAVHVNDVPLAQFDMTPEETTLLNSKIEFTNTSLGATEFFWVFDTINNLGESISENPSFVFPNQLPDEYFIKLTVKNDLGCEDFITKKIVIEEDLSIFVPNSFTPNGDGKNDYFFAVGKNLDPSFYHIVIFDRWGKTVFESNDINAKWNGSVNGGEYYAGTSVFVYRITYKLSDSTEKQEISGSIQLIR